MKKLDKDIQMLGPQAGLEGNLVFEGTLFMNGHVKGAIESRAGSVVIGSSFWGNRLKPVTCPRISSVLLFSQPLLIAPGLFDRLHHLWA